MVVHFYEIQGCTCDNVDNRPVLVAPKDLPLDMLAYYEFVLLEDGRWVHFLTTEEYAHVMKGYPDHDVVFRHPYTYPPMKQCTPEETAKGNKLARLGIGLACGSLVLAGIIHFIVEKEMLSNQTPLVLLGVLIVAAQIAAFRLMSRTRSRYPDNKLGIVLKRIFIAELILLAISPVVAYFVDFYQTCDNFMHIG